ncbi:hypothetical protein D9611_007187 [Ephemerocybe angulata]|uniref:Cytochrome P450 n=1 Tax=Ephemerocybe angulata TaxID=980116 RepID=A0A8H5B2S3_9AGAR|nr:hypothetical protein D9611_007187 [Tulosesus angulatus]
MAVDIPPILAGLLAKLPSGSGRYVRGDQGSVSLSLVLVTVAVVLATSSLVKFVRGLKAVNYMPGLRTPFSPFSLPGVLSPTAWWNPGLSFLWNGRKHHSLYKRFNSETFSVTPWIAGAPLIVTSNLDVLRQIAFGSHRTDFAKPEEMSQALLFWGQNLVAADGDTWRTHRRVVGPAFNTKLYEDVWVKTAEIYAQMVEEEGWASKDTIDVPVVQKLTFQFALLVISRCGFGLSFSWFEPPAAENGGMTVQQALRIITDRNTALVFLPKWVRKLPFKYLGEIEAAVDTMMTFMKEQIARRRDSVKSNDAASDAFTLMIKANEAEGNKYALDDSELIGNVFILLFAGHETTAHTLAASLAFLACNPDIQQEILDHILQVVGWDRAPAFEDYASLDKVLAVFLETLRMFPSGYLMFRQATKDTTIKLPRPVGEEGVDTIPVPKGTTMVVDVVGLEYNPRYYDEPETFKPSRWYGASKEGDNFTAFSVGPRECVGRRFATSEAVCFLTLLIRDYKLEPLLQKGETVGQWKERVLDATLFITLGVKDTPIRLVRREKGRA